LGKGRGRVKWERGEVGKESGEGKGGYGGEGKRREAMRRKVVWTGEKWECMKK